MDFSTLEKLINLVAPSGFEKQVRDFLTVEYKKLGFEISSDGVGSLIATKKSSTKNAPLVVVDAHMDEVGFMLTKLNENGSASFDVLGGISIDPLPGNHVVFINEDGKLVKGVIAIESPHLAESKKDETEVEDLWIDFGVTSLDELKALKLRVASFGAFSPYYDEKEKRITAKSIDDRVGIFIALNVAKEIAKKEFPFDIAFVNSVMEEVGLRGAKTSGQKLKPDFVITCDVSPVKDGNAKTNFGDLGAGTILRIMDAGYITPLAILDYHEALAKKNKIKTQYYASKGGTNAFQYHLVHEGGLVLQTTLPGRYLHSAVSVVDKGDIEETFKMIVAILGDLTSAKIKALKPK